MSQAFSNNSKTMIEFLFKIKHCQIDIYLSTTYVLSPKVKNVLFGCNLIMCPVSFS